MNAGRPIYLNHAGTSWPKPAPVFDAMRAAMDASPKRYTALFETAREQIASDLGAADPGRVLLTPGCTSALAVVLGSLPWEPGDVVVTSSLEHEAMLAPIEALQRLRGVVHQAIGYRVGSVFDFDELDSLLATQPVRAIAVTAASNVTGERLPVERIVERGREHGCVSIVDAAQVAGLVPIDVQKLGADAVTIAGHKGPQGPQGIGVLWTSPSLELAVPIDYCAVGSVNLAGAAGLAAGLRWLASSEAPPRDRGIELRRRLVDALADRRGCLVLGGNGPATAAASIVIENLPLSRAEAAFSERGIIVRSGRHCAPHVTRMLGYPEGTLRLSFGVTNEERDLERVLSVIEELATPDS